MDAVSLIPLVVVGGFLDGIHPCGFAVLLFFIAFLFSIKRTRSQILSMGWAYIAGVFLAYSLIGLGILQVFTFFSGHFMAQVGATLLIILGLLNILSVVANRYGMNWKLPGLAFSENVESTIRKATVPAALIAGFLVGLCAFPCVGGLYVAVLGLVSAHATFGEGLFYLFLYNVMFVMPLILALVFSSNGKVLEWIEGMEQKHLNDFKLVLGAGMLLLGLFILYGGIL
ncbi:hypothetical protein KJ765_03005 [Candidatus Micrarchaeota archaeon]|nr:hypothetical protein [Candidatus Micrarchaeota archaeon]